MSSRVRLLIAVVALCSASSVWAGDQGPGPLKGQFYIHPMYTWFDPPGKLGYDDSAPDPVSYWAGRSPITGRWKASTTLRSPI